MGKINQKLNVDGIIYSKKLNTKGINLPNIQITPQGIKVTGDTKIQTGNSEISFENILNKLSYVDKLMKICGKNFERCKALSDEELKKESIKQNMILMNLKKLRSES